MVLLKLFSFFIYFLLILISFFRRTKNNIIKNVINKHIDLNIINLENILIFQK